MEKISENEFKALISLLDDPDEEVIHHVSLRLKELGIKGVDKLENAWEFAGDELTQMRIESLIQDIQFERLSTELLNWKDNDNEDLLLGAILVAKFRYPDLDESLIYRSIGTLAQSIWLELNNNLTPLEEIHVFNNVFYTHTGFIGEQEGFDKIDLSYINKVLEFKKGNSHALGILYLILSRYEEMNLPIYGIALPHYFVLAYINDQYTLNGLSQVKKSDISFYINPLNDGSIFQSKHIGSFLKQMNVTPEPHHYLPIDNVAIIGGLLNHLMLSYEHINKEEQAVKLKALHKLFMEG